jgi:hypothetical protein
MDQSNPKFSQRPYLFILINIAFRYLRPMHVVPW